MAKGTEPLHNIDVAEMRAALASRILTLAQSPGEHVTAIPGLSLFRRIEPTACQRVFYEPSLAVFTQGRKFLNVGGTEYECDDSSFVLSAIDMPVQSRVVQASEKVPLLSMLLRLDMGIVREVLSREDLPDVQSTSQRRGLVVGETTPELLSACDRLIQLLHSPEDIPFMAPLIHRELVYRILRTPQGERLRSIATRGDLSHRTARAIAWLRTNYTKPLHMEELAAIAQMGVSTLHHQFRALTTMSPLQYQKQLRLQAARERMLTGGIDASTAAYEVGYESVSQFSREYSRLFGQPPIRDIKTLRDGIGSATQVA
ncbi:MAG: AraC family transcriptional regulator [Acidobacteriaceae bacterium]|nr:AraC family transcriptional regulator [Acidobacteriaceae bacterium]